MRYLWLIFGALAALVGLVWTLQGLGILGGSVMSGRSIFIVIGLLVVAIGVALVGIGIRQMRSPSA